MITLDQIERYFRDPLFSYEELLEATMLDLLNGELTIEELRSEIDGR